MRQSKPFSRREFTRWAASLSVVTEAALAQRSMPRGQPPPDAVMINANENPLGPCAEALEAMAGAVKRGGRYAFFEPMELRRLMSEQEGVELDQVQAFAGSSDPLHRVVLAFCGPGRSYVTADPAYESGDGPAEFRGAAIHRVPLTKEYAHDVRAMLQRAGEAAGVFYVCNPNNPTGTLTPREDIEYLVANKPAGSVVLVDEAYIHFSGAKSCVDMVASGKDVIVLRTFSKIYGMAGLRAGVAMGRPDLLAKIAPYATMFLPCTGLAGAIASLKAKDVVAERRQYVKEVREGVFSWMSGKGLKSLFMSSSAMPLPSSETLSR
ncbi:MAG: aminotransferase class I/II-fold pyridoxal phosphate-dependent enzyme [Acidobacteria bacterium]|nr:aminotransferase class I/II-fold pyridoxal phosphate-dependent enzyme [Acidobacteriota bacterium]